MRWNSNSLPHHGRLDHLLLNILDIEVQRRRSMDNITKRDFYVLEQRIEWPLGGEIRHNYKVDLAFPRRVGFDNIVRLFLGAHGGSHGVSTLCRLTCLIVHEQCGKCTSSKIARMWEATNPFAPVSSTCSPPPGYDILDIGIRYQGSLATSMWLCRWRMYTLSSIHGWNAQSIPSSLRM